MKIAITAICIFLNSIINGQHCINKSEDSTCVTHFMIESVLSYPVSLCNNIDRHWDFATNLGVVHHVNDHIGIGGHFFLDYYVNGGGHVQYGVRPRLSYNFNKDWVLNFSPGIILYDSPFPKGLAGYSLETSIKWKNHLGITIRYDDLKDHNNTPLKRQVLNLGIATGGKKSVGLTLVSLLGVVIAIFSNNT